MPEHSRLHSSGGQALEYLEDKKPGIPEDKSECPDSSFVCSQLGRTIPAGVHVSFMKMSFWWRVALRRDLGPDKAGPPAFSLTVVTMNKVMGHFYAMELLRLHGPSHTLAGRIVMAGVGDKARVRGLQYSGGVRLN